MEKAIEIKRKAQRAILSGDLNAALAEYEKLVVIGDPDPYYCVLLADLLYKMGNSPGAQTRYLEAIEGYSKSGLYKNGIAVCKKLTRLSLAPIDVPRWLAKLYSLDGLSTEAGLAYQQLAEVLVKSERIDEARTVIQQAIALTPDSSRLYERLGEVEVLAGNSEAAGEAWSDAAAGFERSGQTVDVNRCRSRIAQLRLASPSRANPPRTEAAPERVANGPKTLAWEAPESAVEAAALSISHGPPSPDRDADSVEETDADYSSGEDAEPAQDVSVERGFDGLDGQDENHPHAYGDDAEATAEALASPVVPTAPEPVAVADDPFDDAPEREDSGAEADADADADADVDEDAGADAEADAAAALARATEEAVSAALDFGTPTVAAEPASAGFSLAGLDPDEYSLEDVPEPVAVTPRAPQPRFDPSSEVPVREHSSPALAGFVESISRPAPTAIQPPTPASLPRIEPPSAGLGIERFNGASPSDAPGLGANARGDREAPAVGARNAARPPADAPEGDADLAQVSMILAEAQTCFHAGDRDAATMALIRAAQAYDVMGRLDSAVAIYRSLGQSPDVSLQLMMLWLKNCQRRNDRDEASRVASDLGERALNDEDVAGAKEWFERARVYDPSNELPNRRLKSIAATLAGETAAADLGSAAPAPAGPSLAGDAGQLNVRTHHPEPVVVDLGSLIEEFQRAVEPELASDPQGQYDLGMSYREMGLLEQAVQSLRAAAQAPGFRLRAGELGGRCLLDLGRFDEASEMLRYTLEAPGLLPTASVDLRYQLALALEAAGRAGEALIEFERVYAAQANYPDVAIKIRLLRRTAEAA